MIITPVTKVLSLLQLHIFLLVLINILSSCYVQKVSKSNVKALTIVVLISWNLNIQKKGYRAVGTSTLL
jgi:hypothetical protein